VHGQLAGSKQTAAKANNGNNNLKQYDNRKHMCYFCRATSVPMTVMVTTKGMALFLSIQYPTVLCRALPLLNCAFAVVSNKSGVLALNRLLQWDRNRAPGAYTCERGVIQCGLPLRSRKFEGLLIDYMLRTLYVER
jgi:hypothetical protein